MQVERTVLKAEQQCRHDLPVICENDQSRVESEDGRERIRRPEAFGCQDRVDPEPHRLVMDDRPPDRLSATGRARRGRDDPDQSDVFVLGEAPQALPAEPATPQEDGPHARAAGPLVGHARALVASRISASSSSSPAPTAISSSIESR